MDRGAVDRNAIAPRTGQSVIKRGALQCCTSACMTKRAEESAAPPSRSTPSGPGTAVPARCCRCLQLPAPSAMPRRRRRRQTPQRHPSTGTPRSPPVLHHHPHDHTTTTCERRRSRDAARSGPAAARGGRRNMRATGTPGVVLQNVFIIFIIFNDKPPSLVAQIRFSLGRQPNHVSLCAAPFFFFFFFPHRLDVPNAYVAQGHVSAHREE